MTGREARFLEREAESFGEEVARTIGVAERDVTAWAEWDCETLTYRVEYQQHDWRGTREQVLELVADYVLERDGCDECGELACVCVEAAA